MKPSVELLRRVSQVQTVSAEEAESLQGDFCDAIILAADAIRQKTFGRKFQRKIVLFTDAGHPVVMDSSQTLQMIDSLREMECRLEVIGMDFMSSSAAVFDTPAKAPQSEPNKRVKVEEGEDENEEMNDIKEEEGERV